ncbi:hypothetical protein EDM56_14015 [Brevibacillus fluminis]|uniref:Uncharacterized protein n=1 Tax=Brevibacillus fluminis TaxID=511487 RepID=A0A3M8DJX0_9BACL|nr:hypothetical protein [Brevibacillus fluminis]RNB87685.1 hypothetical protein EDM56_14015 [Brevibacillus fluminis]
MNGNASTHPGYKNTLLICSFGSLAAFICLIYIYFLQRPDFPFSQFEILSGAAKPNPSQLTEYSNYLSKNFSIDCLYLFGHLLMWLGYGLVVRRRISLLGTVIILLGIISGTTDFTENILRTTIVTGLQAGFSSVQHWGMLWSFVFDFSVWAIFITLVFVIAGIWGQRIIDRIFVLFGLVGLFSASYMYYDGFDFGFVWLIGWHGSSGFYLWRQSRLE